MTPHPIPTPTPTPHPYPHPTTSPLDQAMHRQPQRSTHPFGECESISSAQPPSDRYAGNQSDGLARCRTARRGRGMTAVRTFLAVSILRLSCAKCEVGRVLTQT
jgi:hypothetical protein